VGELAEGCRAFPTSPLTQTSPLNFNHNQLSTSIFIPGNFNPFRMTFPHFASTQSFKALLLLQLI
jgi:hypothetical protein